MRKIIAVFLSLALVFSCATWLNSSAVKANAVSTMIYENLIAGQTGSKQVDAETIAQYGIAHVEYRSDNTDVVTIDDQGNYTAVAPGTAWVTVSGYDEEYYSYVYQVTYVFTVGVNMDSVTLGVDHIKDYLFSEYGKSYMISVNSSYIFSSWDYDTSFSITSSNKDMYVYGSLNNNVISLTVQGSGSTKVTITINGKSFVIPVQINRVSISKTSVLLSKGKKEKLKIKGTSEKVKWSSSNKKVATVSSSGVVKAKKNGNVIITAETSGGKTGCVVSVTAAKTVKIIKYAKKMAKNSKYSQAKRMQKGYYDCSSLVWRSYAKYKKYIGSRSYAPTAADLAVYCKNHGKIVSKSCSYKQVEKMKYQPGDLLFRTGSNNGRYKGIYHVEMFAGYSFSGFDENGKPVISASWANRGDYYWVDSSCMMGRP